MQWVSDNTGRFRERPHYEESELDVECEEFAHSVLRLRNNGELRFPIATDELTVMIEKSGADLDLYADLSAYGTDVEGVTEFVYGKRPLVKISHLLAEDPCMGNRFRTTLTHECGHVRHHGHLWEMKASNGYLYSSGREDTQVCKREKIVKAKTYDWMEWQASYCGGALLMPLSNIQQTCHAFMLRQGTGPFPLSEGMPESNSLIECVASTYQVSRDAARVRLLRIGRLVSVGNRDQSSFWG